MRIDRGAGQCPITAAERHSTHIGLRARRRDIRANVGSARHAQVRDAGVSTINVRRTGDGQGITATSQRTLGVHGRAGQRPVTTTQCDSARVGLRARRRHIGTDVGSTRHAQVGDAGVSTVNVHGTSDGQGITATGQCALGVDGRAGQRPITTTQCDSARVSLRARRRHIRTYVGSARHAQVRDAAVDTVNVRSTGDGQRITATGQRALGVHGRADQCAVATAECHGVGIGLCTCAGDVAAQISGTTHAQAGQIGHIAIKVCSPRNGQGVTTTIQRALGVDGGTRQRAGATAQGHSAHINLRTGGGDTGTQIGDA